MTGRNLMGGVFPLIDGFMFRRLTFAGASSLLGGVVSSYNSYIADNTLHHFSCAFIEDNAE
jgi:hypothetical protein